MKHWKRKTALTAAALLVLSGGGYYAFSEADESTAAETAAAAVDLRLPLSAYRLGLRDQSDASRAEGLLVDACMKKAGFTWYAPVTPLPPDPLRRRYGVIDSQVAERYGYHPPPDGFSADIARRRLEILKDSKANAAYYGPEKARQQGCAVSSAQELARGAGNLTNTLADRLSWQSLEVSEKHPAVVSAFRAWKKCMHTRGHDYATPDDAMLDKAWKLESSAAAGTKERAVAVADVECKDDVGLVRIRVAAETEIQQDVIAANASELKSLDKRLDVYRKNVRSVLDRLDSPSGT